MIIKETVFDLHLNPAVFYSIYFTIVLLVFTNLSFANGQDAFKTWGWWEKVVLELLEGIKTKDYFGDKYEGAWCISKYSYAENINREDNLFIDKNLLDRWLLKNGKLYHLSTKQQREIENLLSRTKNRNHEFIIRTINFTTYEDKGETYIIVGIYVAPLMGQGVLYRLQYNNKKEPFLELVKRLWVA
jgi:hypothetical protein